MVEEKLSALRSENFKKKHLGGKCICAVVQFILGNMFSKLKRGCVFFEIKVIVTPCIVPYLPWCSLHK